MDSDRLRFGFFAAGGANIAGVLVFSAGFTNHHLNEAFPEVFSNFGLIVIILWGAAYIAVANRFYAVRPLVALFAIEKLVYVISWIYWLAYYRDTLSMIAESSILTAAFLVVYGVNDIIFGVFFVIAYRSASSRLKKPVPSPLRDEG